MQFGQHKKTENVLKLLRFYVIQLQVRFQCDDALLNYRLGSNLTYTIELQVRIQFYPHY